MTKRYLHLIVMLFLIFGSSVRVIAVPFYYSNESEVNERDSIPGNQMVYNGRIWKDIYVSVQDDQFLFSDQFLPGRVTMNGKTFNNLKLRYDILNDEIMTITDVGLILQLNKEMIDNFTLTFNSRIYNFSHLVTDSLNTLSGYVNLLYNGKSVLYLKHKKDISGVGPGKNYENFVQLDRVYINKEGIIHHVRSKRDFKKLFSDKKYEIKEFIRSSTVKISVKIPETFVPVLEYYDSIIP